MSVTSLSGGGGVGEHAALLVLFAGAAGALRVRLLLFGLGLLRLRLLLLLLLLLLLGGDGLHRLHDFHHLLLQAGRQIGKRLGRSREVSKQQESRRGRVNGARLAERKGRSHDHALVGHPLLLVIGVQPLAQAQQASRTTLGAGVAWTHI